MDFQNVACLEAYGHSDQLGQVILLRPHEMPQGEANVPPDNGLSLSVEVLITQGRAGLDYLEVRSVLVLK